MSKKITFKYLFSLILSLTLAVFGFNIISAYADEQPPTSSEEMVTVDKSIIPILFTYSTSGLYGNSQEMNDFYNTHSDQFQKSPFGLKDGLESIDIPKSALNTAYLGSNDRFISLYMTVDSLYNYFFRFGADSPSKLVGVVSYEQMQDFQQRYMSYPFTNEQLKIVRVYFDLYNKAVLQSNTADKKYVYSPQNRIDTNGEAVEAYTKYSDGESKYPQLYDELNKQNFITQAQANDYNQKIDQHMQSYESVVASLENAVARVDQVSNTSEKTRDLYVQDKQFLTSLLESLTRTALQKISPKWDKSQYTQVLFDAQKIVDDNSPKYIYASSQLKSDFEEKVQLLKNFNFSQEITQESQAELYALVTATSKAYDALDGVPPIATTYQLQAPKQTVTVVNRNLLEPEEKDLIKQAVIDANPDLPAGYEISVSNTGTVTVTYSDNSQASLSAEKVAIERSEVPTLNAIKSNTTVIEGISSATGATIIIQLPDGRKLTTTVNADNSWSIPLSSDVKLQAGQSIIASQISANKAESRAVEQKVGKTYAQIASENGIKTPSQKLVVSDLAELSAEQKAKLLQMLSNANPEFEFAINFVDVDADRLVITFSDKSVYDVSAEGFIQLSATKAENGEENAPSTVSKNPKNIVLKAKDTESSLPLTGINLDYLLVAISLLAFGMCLILTTSQLKKTK